jgi:hypothetical protein
MPEPVKPMSSIDWSSDEAVVKAAVPHVRLYGPTGDGCHLMAGELHLAYSPHLSNIWKKGRASFTVQAYERAHNPAYAATPEPEVSLPQPAQPFPKSPGSETNAVHVSEVETSEAVAAPIAPPEYLVDDRQSAKDIPLMPCPWCGSSATLDAANHPQRSWVDCYNFDCGASGPSLTSAVRAVEAWNNLARKVTPAAASEAKAPSSKIDWKNDEAVCRAAMPHLVQNEGGIIWDSSTRGVSDSWCGNSWKDVRANCKSVIAFEKAFGAKICICGHEYRRHFDPFEPEEGVHCKYCGCVEFEEAWQAASPAPAKENFEELVKRVHPDAYEDKNGDIVAKRNGLTYFLGRGWEKTSQRCHVSQLPPASSSVPAPQEDELCGHCEDRGSVLACECEGALRRVTNPVEQDGTLLPRTEQMCDDITNAIKEIEQRMADNPKLSLEDVAISLWIRASDEKDKASAALTRIAELEADSKVMQRQVANPALKIIDHKWLDHECIEKGCQSITLKGRNLPLEARLDASERCLQQAESELQTLRASKNQARTDALNEALETVSAVHYAGGYFDKEEGARDAEIAIRKLLHSPPKKDGL